MFLVHEVLQKNENGPNSKRWCCLVSLVSKVYRFWSLILYDVKVYHMR